MRIAKCVPSPLVAEAAAHLHPIRVYFEDTDAGGMVYYANYLKFAERARTEMLRSAGFNHAAMVAQDGLMLVVRRCSAEFHRSARLDDELAVETRVSGLAGASILLDQVIRRGSEVLVEITVTIACVTKEGASDPAAGTAAPSRRPIGWQCADRHKLTTMLRKLKRERDQR